MQSKATHGSIIFFELVSIIGILSVFIIAGLAWALFSRPRAYYYMLAVGFNLYVMCIGKMAYHKPRPFMVDDDV